MTKRKVLIRITVALLIFLVACTVLSRSIYLAMLPQVSIAKMQEGVISSDLSYTGTFDYTEKQTVRAEAVWKLTEVNFQTGDSVEKGDVLAKVDMTDADLTCRQLELNVSSAQSQLKNAYGKDAKAQAQLALDMAERALEQFTESYPKNGVIRAESDGVLLSCNYQIGDAVPAGEVIMEVRTEDSMPVAQWAVTGSEAEKFDVGVGVLLSFTGLKRGSKEAFSLRGNIISKTIDTASGATICRALLKGFNGEIPLNTVVDITYSETVASGMIVPLSALVPMGGENYILYVVETQQGVFGEEHIVRQIQVKKVGDNNVDAVVEGALSPLDSIVSNSSKTLTDGASVALG